jgi:dinuclear metal center YbgI/SA1388 family protein
MKLKELCSFLNSAVPLSFQESYDNSGLQLGNPEKEITSALLTLDVTEEVLAEAAETGCNLIISHHPIIFNGVKRITGETSAERIIIKALKLDISVYSAHTNLDTIPGGVSWRMAEKLDLRAIKVLSPLKNRLLKLVTFIPETHLDKVRDALFDAGAGVIGGYDRCGFTSQGTGSFRGGNKTNPFVGEKEKVHYEKEVRFETILFTHRKNSVINALRSSHPYEEPAFDIYALENDNTEAGMGCAGDLPRPMSEEDFLRYVSSTFNAEGLRHTRLTGRKISRVALCGGSGSSLIHDAISSGADAFITADVRYHVFFDADHSILLTDIGHFESEKFSAEVLYDLIIKKFPTFALRFSEINTNPINYL